MLPEGRDDEDVLYVEPGQLLVCTEPRRLRTILGSCVSVCLYEPTQRMGGMNHFLLPRSPESEGRSFRYGDAAMRGLIERLERLGCERRALCAHVFGGARVLSALSETLHLGRCNVDFALGWLQQQGVTVVGSCVLGSVARRLEFDIATGICLAQLLGAT